MFQWMMAVAVALSTMLAVAGAPADVTPAQVMNGEAMAQLRTALQVAAQNRPDEVPEAAVMARLQHQVRAMIREAQEEGLDEAAMEQLMERVRERLQLQLEQCEEGACQFGLEQALQATEQWRHGFQSREANGEGAPGGPVQGAESGPPADTGGPAGPGGLESAGGRGAGGGGGR
jgi:TolA-binding protein